MDEQQPRKLIITKRYRGQLSTVAVPESGPISFVGGGEACLATVPFGQTPTYDQQFSSLGSDTIAKPRAHDSTFGETHPLGRWNEETQVTKKVDLQ